MKLILFAGQKLANGKRPSTHSSRLSCHWFSSASSRGRDHSMREEIWQDCVVAVLETIPLFDPSKGCTRFSTFANLRIHQASIQSIQRQVRFESYLSNREAARSEIAEDNSHQRRATANVASLLLAALSASKGYWSRCSTASADTNARDWCMRRRSSASLVPRRHAGINRQWHRCGKLRQAPTLANARCCSESPYRETSSRDRGTGRSSGSQLFAARLRGLSPRTARRGSASARGGRTFYRQCSRSRKRVTEKLRDTPMYATLLNSFTSSAILL